MRLEGHHGSARPSMGYSEREWRSWKEWYERPWRKPAAKKQPYWSCACGAADNWATRTHCRECEALGPRRATGLGIAGDAGAKGEQAAAPKQDKVHQLNAAIALVGALGEECGGSARQELERKLEEAKAAKRAGQAPHAAWKEAQLAFDRAEKRVAKADTARKECAEKLAKIEAELAQSVVDREAAKAALEAARATVFFPPPSSGPTDAFEARVQACRALLAGFAGSSVHAEVQTGLEHIMGMYKAELERQADVLEVSGSGGQASEAIRFDSETGDDEGMEAEAEGEAEEHGRKVQRLLDKAAEWQTQAQKEGKAVAEEGTSPDVAGLFGDALDLLREAKDQRKA